MKLEEKYTEEALEGIGSSDFFYDLIYGGYIEPDKILIDKERAKKLQEAADLLFHWMNELIEDGILEEI